MVPLAKRLRNCTSLKTEKKLIVLIKAHFVEYLLAIYFATTNHELTRQKIEKPNIRVTSKWRKGYFV